MKKLMVGLATAGFVGAFSAPAHAGIIQLRISSSTCSGICTTQTVNGTQNGVSFSGNFGDVHLDITGTSNNPGNFLASVLQQISTTAHTLSGDEETVTLEVTETDFLAPIGDARLGSSLSGTGVSIPGPSTAVLTSAYDGANSAFAYNIMPADVSCSLSGVAFTCVPAGSSSTLLNSTAGFSLTNRLVIHLAGGDPSLDTISLTATTALTAVPDGGMTMSLLGMGMAGLGLMIRRRK